MNKKIILFVAVASFLIISTTAIASPLSENSIESIKEKLDFKKPTCLKWLLQKYVEFLFALFLLALYGIIGN